MISRPILLTLLLIISMNSSAFDSRPERRKEQNPTVPAYFIVPLPYSKPGIGDGILFLGNIANVAGSTADISVIEVTGDAGGTIINGEEIPLYFDWLNLEFNYQNITRADVKNYSIRGMNGTAKNDYNTLEVGYSRALNATLIFNFYQKRLNFFYSHSNNDYRLDAIYDNNGVLIETLNYSGSDKQDRFAAELDYTDDYLDPRNGLRFGLSYQDHNAANSDNAEFFTVDLQALAYLSMGKADTLVFNYYQSDAHVSKKGNIDPAAIRADIALNCAPLDSACLQAEQELVDNFISERSNGTASSMGGDNRLRAYPSDRFNGAHSAFLGMEYRWNITQESTPFDYFVWKDVRTGIQAAFFSEIATVSEQSSDLWKETRYSVGAGLRLITGSGGVYRAEISTGNEGIQPIIIFEYPWK